MLTEHAQLLRSLALSGAGVLRNLNSWSTSASCIVCIAYDFSFVFFFQCYASCEKATEALFQLFVDAKLRACM